MPVNLIPTKIIIPGRSPSVIRRSRLVDYLHENLGRKLLLVTAPAGYGKTTLLIDFASDVDFPVYFVLILDDWQLVSDEAAISNLLDQLLRYVPEHAHLIVAGRALPRGPLVRLAAQSAVAGPGAGGPAFQRAAV